MKILVTGAAGFIGSSVVDALLARGDEVVGLDNFDDFYDPEVKRANLRAATGNGAFRLAELDVRDKAGVRVLLAETKPEAIFHAAARAGVRPSIDDPALYASVNVEGTTCLLEAARRLEPRPNFVLASSSSIYGAREKTPFREDEPCDRPESPYAATKRACEVAAVTAARLHALPVTCLRLFTAYGPRQRPEMAIHKFTRLILEGKPIPVFGNGSSSRDYTYVDDIVAGVLAAIDRSFAREIVNLGSGRPVRLDELIAGLEKAAGRKAEIERLPDQLGDVPRTVADVSKARRLLGYEPRMGIDEGLARFVEWYRERVAARRQTS